MEGIFSDVNIFKNRLLEISVIEKSPIELIGIMVYGGMYIFDKQMECEWIIYDKYIGKINDFVLTKYKILNRYEYLEESNKLLNEKNKLNFKTYLNCIESYIKKRYFNLIHEIICSPDTNNKDLIDELKNIYLSIDLDNYLKNLIYFEHIDEIKNFICVIYGEYINSTEIENIIERLKIENIEYMLTKKIQENIILNIEKKKNIDTENIEKYNDLISTININDILFNYTQNVIHQSTLNNKMISDDFFDNVDIVFDKFTEDLETNYDMEKIIPLMEFIKRVENEILDEAIKRCKNEENIDIIFPEICRSKIISNNLNVSVSSEKLFFDYFMTKKSMVEFSLTLDNIGKTIEDVVKIYNK